MTVRPLHESDIPALKRMAEASGYPYPQLSEKSGQLECVYVIANEDDQPVMACAAERICQLFLYVPTSKDSLEAHPAAKLHALRLLHDAMAADLRAKGYTEANAFIPPSIAGKFGRRLMRSFGWVKNWPSWCKHL